MIKQNNALLWVILFKLTYMSTEQDVFLWLSIPWLIYIGILFITDILRKCGNTV